MALSNSYSLKAVSSKDQRPCFICGKFSSSVLDAPDDFFFVCLSHTKDTGFCTSLSDSVREDGNEIVKSKKEITESKTQQINKSDSKDSQKDEAPSKIEGPPIFKLHRSILFLREQEKSKREKLNLLKNLK